MSKPLFKRFIAIVGQPAEFIKEMEDVMKAHSAISGVLSSYSVLYENLSEIFKKDLTIESFKSNEKFSSPIRITDHEPRAFYAKMGRGIFGVSQFVGATFQTPKELLDYFEKKVGAKAYGEGWLQSLLLERMVVADRGVFLLKDVTVDQLEALKAVYGKSIAVVQVFEGENQEPLELADVLVSKTDNVNEETIKVMNELKEKWKTK
jgi:hypothetical protein